MGQCGEVAVTVSVACWQTYDFVLTVEAEDWPAGEDERRDYLTQLAIEEYQRAVKTDTLPDPGHTEVTDGPFLEGHDIITDPHKAVADDLLNLIAELKE